MPMSKQQTSPENIIKGARKLQKTEIVMSINPEICTLALKNKKFKRVIATSRYHIVDGFGVVLAARILGLTLKGRYTGVDLMKDVLEDADAHSLRILLIGGKRKVAERVADCYSTQESSSIVRGIEGYKNIHKPTRGETDKIFSIVADTKPHIVFVAFGSPTQELWIDENREKFKGAVCIGVGGAFDFISGDITRAPYIMRSLGLEWLYRLLKEPSRWRRQLRLPYFVFLVLLQKLRIRTFV